MFYFRYSISKHEAIADYPLVQIYVNKIKNRIVFKIKAGYKLESLSPETIKLLGSAKKDADQDKHGEDAPKLESVEAVLVHCSFVNNSYQQPFKILFTFVTNKQFEQLVAIAPHSLIMLNTTNNWIFIHWNTAYWSKYQATWNRR